MPNRRGIQLFGADLNASENESFWNKLLCNSPLDLLAPDLLHLVEKKILAKGNVDPVLIVKHPELLHLISLDDVSSERQSPAYFVVLSMYGTQFKRNYDSVILSKFLLHLSWHPGSEELVLKSQLVDPFCTFINGVDNNSLGILILPLFQCLIKMKVEPLFLRLRILRCLSEKFAKETPNDALLHMFGEAMKECDAKSLLSVVNFFFVQNSDRLNEVWEKQYGKLVVVKFDSYVSFWFQKAFL